MAKKVTFAEIELRVGVIAKMLIQGVGRADIVRFCSEQWDISERHTDTYLARAKEKIIESTELNRQFEIGRAATRLNNIFAQAMKVQDLKTAIMAQKELSALYALNLPTRQEVTGADGQPLTIRIVREDSPHDETIPDND